MSLNNIIFQPVGWSVRFLVGLQYTNQINRGPIFLLVWRNVNDMEAPVPQSSPFRPVAIRHRYVIFGGIKIRGYFVVYSMGITTLPKLSL